MVFAATFLEREDEATGDNSQKFAEELDIR